MKIRVTTAAYHKNASSNYDINYVHHENFKKKSIIFPLLLPGEHIFGPVNKICFYAGKHPDNEKK